MRLPGNVANRLWQPLEAGAQDRADAGRVAIAPGGFDQHPPGVPIAGEREAGAPHRVVGRSLARHQAAKRHQLPRIVVWRSAPAVSSKR